MVACDLNKLGRAAVAAGIAPVPAAAAAAAALVLRPAAAAVFAARPCTAVSRSC